MFVDDEPTGMSREGTTVGEGEEDSGTVPLMGCSAMLGLGLVIKVRARARARCTLLGLALGLGLRW